MYRINVILFFMLVLNQLFGQLGGTSTFSFLELTNSARLAALGGKNISNPDKDLSFVHDNPALLDSAMSNHLVLNYVNYFAGINFGYVSYARKFNKAGMFAVGLNYINYGTFIKADPTGQITGQFSAFELALNLFWSKVLIDSTLSVGVNLKPIYSQLETYNSFGLAVDAGLTYYGQKGFSAAFVIRNLGLQIKPYTPGNYEKIPLNIQLGITQKLEHAPFRFSVLYQYLNKWELRYDKSGNPSYSSGNQSNNISNNEPITLIDNFFRHFIFGAEFLPAKGFNVLLGYNHQRRKEMMVPTRPLLVGFSWGVFIRISKIKLSYSQAFYHIAGASNHFSLNMNMGDMYKKK